MACKVDKRKISKRELIRHLHSDNNKMDATTRAIEVTMQAAFEGKHTSDYLRQTIFRLKEALAQIGNMVDEADRKNRC
jgi:hypothetical protein